MPEYCECLFQAWLLYHFLHFLLSQLARDGDANRVVRIWGDATKREQELARERQSQNEWRIRLGLVFIFSELTTFNRGKKNKPVSLWPSSSVCCDLSALRFVGVESNPRNIIINLGVCYVQVRFPFVMSGNACTCGVIRCNCLRTRCCKFTVGATGTT